MLYKNAILVFLIYLSTSCYGQVQKKIREQNKSFQISLFPGISTNGIYSGSYYNHYSLNLLGGLSAGNKILEIGLISNVNTKSKTGIQLAGLANVIGANAFINLSQVEERELINKEGFESNSKGIQLAGLLNYVRTHSSGIQLAGALNVVGGDFNGVQIAGIGNSAANATNGYSKGLQLAGLYNISRASIAGMQLSSLFNYTDGTLSGTQLGLINKSKAMAGRHTLPPTKGRSFQIGLLNFSKEMDGTQIGLINFGGAALGKQIGLINFFDSMPTKENTRKGTPIGVLNFNSTGNLLRLTYNELFIANLEYTTGNCLNCSVAQSEMPFNDKFQIYNQNTLILGYDPIQDTWGFGYGFAKILFNKSSMLPTDSRNRKKLISYGIKFIHLNRDMSFDDSFNLLNKLHFEYGKRIFNHYVFVGASLNYFLSETENNKPYKINSIIFSLGDVHGLKSVLWPGYTVGIQL